ncbi:hypothetical protein [Sodalinema gerasimenkoae]|uniref:hypothetical protein n=1 Tax=Sodalinema gerasimenkoae TaxID=2862348 RepID=UPI0013570AA5|nr:hypothetical protein [Sodalinema gerasimenkoae]
MSNLSPEEFQELAAGYVLGDLSSEERQVFQAQLQHHPELAEEVRLLQDVLGAIPYGLPETPPPPGLREAILAAAEGGAIGGFPGNVGQVGLRQFWRSPCWSIICG